MTYQSPGVYIEEVPSGPQPIAAASTSVVAILGVTRKGPVQKPTRITGWSDFVRTFGNAHSRGFTAESVYGFFENGGPAAWVVRVDPSTPASWRLFDVGGVQSFAVNASSPGSWANALSIGVKPDLAGAAGSFYRATVTGGAPVNVTNAGTHVLQVASTAGLRPADSLVLVAAPGAEPVNAPVAGQVVALTATTIELSASGSVVMAAGSVVASAVTTASTSIFLPAGNGFKKGDIVVATTPNGTRVGAVVTDVAAAGSAVVLSLAAAPSAAIPGAAFVQRRSSFSVQATVANTPSGSPPITTVPFSALTWVDPATAPVVGELTASGASAAAARLTTSDGRVGNWVTNKFDMVGSSAPTSGSAVVEAVVSAVRYKETGLSLGVPTAVDIANRYGFLLTGSQIRLTGGSAPLVATRTGAGFTVLPDPGTVTGNYTDAEFLLAANADNGIAVRCAVAPRVGDHLKLGTTYAPITAVSNAGGTVYVLSFAAATAVPVASQDRFALMAIESAQIGAQRFTLTVNVDGVEAESFSGLSLNETHPQYFFKDDVVNGTSALITVEKRLPAAPAIALATMPFYAQANLAGTDAPATNADYKAGLTALESPQEPAMVICPDTVAIEDPLLQADLVGAIVAHCEKFRRFAIIDAPDLDDDTELLAWRNTNLASTYAAMYAPHLNVVTINPDSIDRFTKVPPSGFVAGVFARTDRERGVHKAPGNERVTGTVGLSQAYTQRRQDLLNPASVNLIRAFPGRGTRIWGARNATDDVTWRYVNVRRLFNMVETSVDRSTQWVVFEPNIASTWIRVKVSLENFLDQLWRSGALAGSKPDEAYRVRIGLGETMTETDIDLGLVITEIAIAPSKPAEFVVFRFSHKRLSE